MTSPRQDCPAQIQDSFELARLGREVRGQAPVARFARLVADLPEQRAGAEVSWSVGGETDSLGRAWLRVAAQADLVVRCQRCMQPFVLAVQAGNTLQMMKSEAALDAAEEVDETDEEGYTERIVGSPRLDLLALVEDELILALPYVPKHEACPALPEALADSGAGQTRPSPFAVLGKLKKD